MGNGFGMGFGGVFMWLFWILIIIAIVWGIKSAIENGDGSANKSKSALEILNERYAKGEIDQETYERMRQELSD